MGLSTNISLTSSVWSSSTSSSSSFSSSSGSSSSFTSLLLLPRLVAPSSHWAGRHSPTQNWTLTWNLTTLVSLNLKASKEPSRLLESPSTFLRPEKMTGSVGQPLSSSSWMLSWFSWLSPRRALKLRANIPNIESESISILRKSFSPSLVPVTSSPRAVVIRSLTAGVSAVPLRTEGGGWAGPPSTEL